MNCSRVVLDLGYVVDSEDANMIERAKRNLALDIQEYSMEVLVDFISVQEVYIELTEGDITESVLEDDYDEDED